MRRVTWPGRAGLALAALALAAGVAPARAGEGGTVLMLPVTADNSIVLYRGETHLNAGAAPRLRIKGNQHLLAVAFDTRLLAGRTVTRAELVYHRAAHAIDGVTLATIACPWDELKSCALTSGAGPEPGWGRPAALFPAMTGSNGWTLTCQAESRAAEGVYRWAVAPDLVHACAVGAAHGLSVHEWTVDYSRNPTVHSREARGREPHLLVTLGPPAPAPLPPTGLRLTDAGDPESLRLHLVGPARGFVYEVEVSGRPLPRWNVPPVRPGEAQMIPVRDLGLAPGARVRVSVRTVSRGGERSRAVTVSGRVPDPGPVPEPAAPDLPPPAKGDAPGLVAVPLLDKLDEAGRAVGDLPRGYLARNAVFDGRTVRLAAARGEVVGFLALVKGTGRVTAACEVGGLRVDVRRALYVDGADGRRLPDPLVPMPAGGVALRENAWTPLAVDVYVAFDERRERLEGALVLSDGRRLPVEIAVRPFALPRRARFLCEMNGYGLPDRVSEYEALQRVAYDHRVHVNLLHYSHRTAAADARRSTMDMRMADGRRMDERRYNGVEPGATTTYWADFAAAFGPHLSGALHAGGHRGPVAAPGFYLTFHESWPLPMRPYWNGRLDAYQAFADHPEYARTWVALLADFFGLARRAGWTDAGFQVYLNNKGSPDDPTKGPWTLDEPAGYFDYRALAYYGDLVRRARPPGSPVTVRYRIDISRPQFDRGQLWGKADLWVVSTSAFERYPRVVADRMEFDGLDAWIYGSTSKVEHTNRLTWAWVLGGYRGGASGVVPWQTIDKDGSALATADTLGLFIFEPREGGPARLHHSLRLKVFRRAQQDIEYLELARERCGWTRGQLGAFIDRCLGDAPASPEAARRLREAAAAAIQRSATDPSSRK